MSSAHIHKKGFVPEPPQGCDLSKDRILLHCCCAPCSTAIIEWMVSQGLRPGIFFSNSNIVPFNEYTVRRDELRRYAAAHGLETIDDEYDHSSWLAFVRRLEIPPIPTAPPVAVVRQAHQPAEAPRPSPVAEPVEAPGCANLAAEAPHPTLFSELVKTPIRIADMPERGPRCLECFKFRLLRAARYASTHGYRLLTTTLASSRWKDLAQVDTAGRWACEIVNSLTSGNISPSVSALSVASVPPAIDLPSIDALPSSDLPLSAAPSLPTENLSAQPAEKVLWWNQNWRRGGLQERRNALIKEWSMYNQTFCGCEFSERH